MYRQVGSLIGYISDSPFRTRLAVALGVLALALVEFSLHVWLASIGVPPLPDALIDATLIGFVFGILLWFVLIGIRDRRARLRQDLERIAELNHEIRNALQVIAHSQYDAEIRHKEIVLESVSRIDTVLKRVFPAFGSSRGKH
jgi:hypothetical protein